MHLFRSSTATLAHNHFAAALLGLVLGAAAAPLTRAADTHAGMMDMASMPTAAVVVLHPTAGNNVHGVIHFTKVADGVHVSGEITGLAPGAHGFHIHEFGDTTAADGTSTGGHFNPMHRDHGARTAEDRHVGDLGNVEADASGKATLDYVDHDIALSGPDSIIGRGVIVHTMADDFKTQPTGNAGGRVAAGVVGIAKG